MCLPLQHANFLVITVSKSIQQLCVSHFVLKRIEIMITYWKLDIN